MNRYKIKTEETHFFCDDGFPMRTIIISPVDELVLPAILFIAEPFGLNDEMTRVASDFASAGYVVVLPDLVSRGPWFRCIRVLMASLKNGEGQGIDDLLAARRFINSLPNVAIDRTAVLGLCMGGGFALILGKTGLFKVSAPFYGQTPASLENSCPIVASFGARDKMIEPHANKLKQEVMRRNIPSDITEYEGVGHSFMNKAPNKILEALGPLLPAHAKYDGPTAAKATRRVLDFIASHI